MPWLSRSDAGELIRLRTEKLDDSAQIAMLKERVGMLQRIESEYSCQIERDRRDLSSLLERLLFVTGTDRKPQQDGRPKTNFDDLPASSMEEYQERAQRKAAQMDAEVAQQRRTRLVLTDSATEEEFAHAV